MLRAHSHPAAWLISGACLLLGACSSEPPQGAPPGQDPAGEAAQERQGGEAENDGREPRHGIVEALRAERDIAHHPSDGRGKAWLVGANETSSGASASFELIYEADEPGIAEEGVVFLQVSPFWGWSHPQTERPEAPGFTTVSFLGKAGEKDQERAPRLEARTVDAQLLAVRLKGRGLEPGERLRFLYGAGDAGARADRFAESAEHFFFAVDGDGDGQRKLIADSPTVDISAGDGAQIIALLPSTSRPGEPVRLHLSVLDSQGNAGTDFTGTLVLETFPEGATDLGSELGDISFKPTDGGQRILDLRPRESGILRLRVRRAGDPGGSTGPELTALSNPLQVSEKGRQVYWGDLQNHSNFSDGTALPEEIYSYARDIAGLDIVSVTDHDHWGMRFLDRHPELWRHIQEVTESFHDPGRFITLRGFEWTNWIYGHRHVLIFDDDPLEILSSIDESFDHPGELWEALRGRRALTIAHHSAGGPIATDWTIPPPPDLEPITEIVSVHGSSEAADSPRLIYQPVAGNFVRGAALDRGYRLGLIGSSDGHDGHPGLGHLASGTGGLAAIMADDLSRQGVYRALRERRVYGTSGVRILLRAIYGGYPMGAEVPLEAGIARRSPEDDIEVAVVPPDQLFVQVIGAGPIERIDLVRSGEITGYIDCQGELACTTAIAVEDLEDGEYLYVRAVQKDGHFAVSSPFFFSAG